MAVPFQRSSPSPISLPSQPPAAARSPSPPMISSRMASGQKNDQDTSTDNKTTAPPAVTTPSQKPYSLSKSPPASTAAHNLSKSPPTSSASKLENGMSLSLPPSSVGVKQASASPLDKQQQVASQYTAPVADSLASGSAPVGGGAKTWGRPPHAQFKSISGYYYANDCEFGRSSAAPTAASSSAYSSSFGSSFSYSYPRRLLPTQPPPFNPAYPTKAAFLLVGGSPFHHSTSPVAASSPATSAPSTTNSSTSPADPLATTPASGSSASSPTSPPPVATRPDTTVSGPPHQHSHPPSHLSHTDAQTAAPTPPSSASTSTASLSGCCSSTGCSTWDWVRQRTGLCLVNGLDSLSIYRFPPLTHPAQAPTKEQKKEIHAMRFRNPIISYSVNSFTSTETMVEILIAFALGNVIIYHVSLVAPCKSVQHRKLNLSRYTTAEITHVCWVPNSKNLFMVATKDGRIVLMDSTRSEPTGSDQVSIPWREVKPPHQRAERCQHFILHNSAHYNPLALWQITEKPLTDLNFSSEGRYLATVGHDCILRIFDFKAELVLGAYKSYYGAFLSVCWSPDSQFVAVGGADDLVSIVDPFVKRRVVGRGQGHKSWVSSLAFNPFYRARDSRSAAGRSEHGQDDGFELASVGYDGRLLIWHFGIEDLDDDDDVEVAYGGPTEATPPRGKDEVPLLEAGTSHTAHADVITDVHFLPEGIATAARSTLKFWLGPVPKNCCMNNTNM
jgi:WD40 repeat protein